MMLWLDEQKNTYGLEAEATGKDGDTKAENLTADENVRLAVLNPGTGAAVTFKNLPAIRFLADGTVDENSPQTLRLTGSSGIERWLIQSRDRSGYEIRDSNK